MASAARHHKIGENTVLRRMREERPGWQFETLYQIPAGFIPSARSPWRRLGPRTREEPP